MVCSLFTAAKTVMNQIFLVATQTTMELLVNVFHKSLKESNGVRKLVTPYLH